MHNVPLRYQNLLLCELGQSYAGQRRFDEALKCFKLSATLTFESSGEGVEYWRVVRSKARLYLYLGEIDKTITTMHSVIDKFRHLFDDNSERMIENYILLTTAVILKGRYE